VVPDETLSGMGQNSQYLRLVGRRAIEKYEWGRDFLVGAVMNLLSLAASAYLGLIPKDDWGKHRLFFILAIVAPYAVIFGLHIVWRLFRAAVVIHVEEDKERGELQHALEQLKSAPPQIELVIHDVVMHRTGDREQRWKNGEFLVQVSAELLNLPSARVEYSAELVYRGEVIELAAVKDVNEWEIIERKYFQQSFPNTPSMLRPKHVASQAELCHESSTYNRKSRSLDTKGRVASFPN